MKSLQTNRIAHLAAAAALCLGLQSAAAAPLDLVTPGFSLKFRPDRAWTYGQIDYKGLTLSGPMGFHGLVLATGPALFIGSGHTEGGKEEVESVAVEVDGQTLSELDGEVECKEAIVTKKSRIGDFTHEAIVRLTAERIDLDYSVTATKDTYAEIIYPYMFCWNPATTEWLAELTTGDVLSGEFRSNNGWQLEKDTVWAAIYRPDHQTAAIVKFAEDLPEGALHKHGYWDREVYHKQYYQSHWKASISNGETFRFKASVQAAQASPEQWKETVQKLMTETKN